MNRYNSTSKKLLGFAEKVNGIIGLISAKNADTQSILLETYRISKINGHQNYSDLGLEARKLVKQQGLQVDAPVFKSRLANFDLTEQQLDVLYRGFVHLETLEQIGSRLSLNGMTPGETLRAAVMKLRSQKLVAA